MSTLTRAQVEDTLRLRVAALAIFAEVDLTAGSSILTDAIGVGLRKTGFTTATIGQILDLDVAVVEDDTYDQVLDIAEWRLLETIQGNLDDVDTIIGPERENFSQVTSQLSLRLLRISRRLEKEYGVFKPQAETGTILNQSSEGDD